MNSPARPSRVPTWQRWVLLLLAAALVAGFVRLGLWQLSRADYKQAQLDSLQSARETAPRPIRSVAELEPLERYLPVALTGTYDPQPLLLDNRIREGRAGVEVISPFRLAYDGGWVLVNRGWLPLPPDRELPRITTPRDQQRISGMLDYWPEVGVQMGNYPELGQPEAVLVPWLDEVRIEAMLDAEVISRVVLLNPRESNGFERDWRIRTLPPSRHWGYALQWFGLALALVVIVGVLLWRGRRRA